MNVIIFSGLAQVRFDAAIIVHIATVDEPIMSLCGKKKNSRAELLASSDIDKFNLVNCKRCLAIYQKISTTFGPCAVRA